MPLGNPSAIAASIASLDANIAAVLASPVPNYSIDGESISAADYVAMLSEKRLLLEAMYQRAQGQFDVRSQGLT